MEQNKAISAEKYIQNNKIEEATRAVNSIYDALVVNPGPSMSKLPEDIFVQYFLPYFKGEKNITEEEKMLSDWISIAGTASSEVSIIDKAGSELYRVPAIFNTDIIDVLNRSPGNSIKDIFGGYDMRMNNLPVIAVNYLIKSLDNKSEELLSNDSTVGKESSVRWTNIFERYDKSSTKSKITENNQTLQDDDIIYD